MTSTSSIGYVVPRWWKMGLSVFLAELDDDLYRTAKSGPITLEIHYRSGIPMLGKVRTLPVPPPLAEFNLASTS